MAMLIPCLPDDIALSCLVRLPFRWRAIARCVCCSWNNAFEDRQQIDSLRLYLGIPPEHWFFIGLQDTKCYPAFLQATEEFTRWLLVDPRESRAVILRNPLAGTSTDLSLRSVATGANIFLTQLTDRGKPGFRCYSLAQMRWSTGNFVQENRKKFACAGLGNFVYFGGGENSERLACRYDTVRNRWERLPDMIMPRINCSGFVMEGKFYVIGGYRRFVEMQESAECFDPATGRWSLMPELFAEGLKHREELNLSEPSVAVVENRLYAMQSYSNEVMEYLQGWQHMGYVGGECERRSYCVNYRVLGVGSELWAIEYTMGKSVCMYSCRPGKGRSGSMSLEWSPIEIPETKDFDNVLTCTALCV